MLHTKFRGNRPSGSGEADFLRVLPYMGTLAIRTTDVPIRILIRTTGITNILC